MPIGETYTSCRDRKVPGQCLFLASPLFPGKGMLFQQWLKVASTRYSDTIILNELTVLRQCQVHLPTNVSALSLCKAILVLVSDTRYASIPPASIISQFFAAHLSLQGIRSRRSQCIRLAGDGDAGFADAPDPSELRRSKFWFSDDRIDAMLKIKFAL